MSGIAPIRAANQGRQRLCAAVVAAIVTTFTLCAAAQSQPTITLTESEVANRVRSVSPTVLAQRSAARTAEIERERAARVLVPEVAVSARYTRLSSVPEAFRSLSFSIPGAPMMDPVVFPQLLDQFAARATITLAVSDLFTRALPALRAAGERVAAARLEAEAQEARAVFDAQNAYIGWLRARAAVRIATSARESFERQRDDVARRVRAGQLPLAQQLPLDVTLSSLRRQEIALQLGRAQAELALRSLLALGDERLEPADENEIAAIPSQTPANRAEISAIDANTRALEGQARATTATLFPSLAVVGGVDVAAPNPRAFAQTSLTPLATWDVTVQLSWSLGQALDAEAALRSLASQRQALTLQRDALSRAIDAEIRSARAECESVQQRLDEAQRGFQAAQTQVEQRRGAFAAGAATATELTIAEAEFFRQQIEQTDAQLELRSAGIKLRFALGLLRPQH